MARAVLITNPVAARTTPEISDTVYRVFRAAGWSIEHVVTRQPSDTRRFSQAAVEDGVDVVAVLGGDGTTMQAAAPLVGTEVGLALIPGGTGNVLAGNLRIPFGPVQAAHVAIEGRRRRIDLGRIERADGVHYFGVACGAGADARVMGGTAADSKRRLGLGGYFDTLFRVLPEVRSTDYVVTVDGRRLDFRAAVVLVLNCGEVIPPLVRVHRDAVPTDGLFDVLVLKADSAWQAIRGVARSFANVVLGTGGTEYLSYVRGQHVVVETEAPEPVQFDGDLAGETPVTMEMVPGAIQVLAAAE